MPWNKEQPAPRALWELIHANFPATRFADIYVAGNIAGTSTPSAHSEGRALDIGLDASLADERLIGDQLFNTFCELAADMQLEEVIWQQKIWSAQPSHAHLCPGASPHTDHVHVAFTRAGSQAPSLPASLAFRLASLRTSLEDLRRASGNLA